MRYFTVIGEDGIVVDVIEAQDANQALRITREMDLVPLRVRDDVITVQGEPGTLWRAS